MNRPGKIGVLQSSLFLNTGVGDLLCTADDFRRDWIIAKFFGFSMLVGAEKLASGGCLRLR